MTNAKPKTNKERIEQLEKDVQELKQLLLARPIIQMQTHPIQVVLPRKRCSICGEYDCDKFHITCDNGTA